MLRLVSKLTRASQRTFATNKITMPSLSPTMEKGLLKQWHVKEGDELAEGDEIADIETDKATVPLEVQENCFIAKLMVTEGTSDINVGDVIAYTVDDKDELKDFKIEESKPIVKAEIKEEEVKQDTVKLIKTGKTYPKHTKINMPALSPTMEAGKIVSWSVEVGQEVGFGDVIASIETDKATMDFELQEEGYIAKILANEDSGSISVGEELVILVDDEDDIAAFADYVPGQEEVKEIVSDNGKTSETELITRREETQLNLDSNKGERIFISPKAKMILEKDGINYANLGIKGSGPEGRIIAQDAEAFLKAPKKETVKQPSQQKPIEKTITESIPSDLYKEIPISSMRKVIAKRLTESKQQIPHYYLSSSIEMGPLLAFKKQIQNETGTKLSVSDFIVKAVSLACMEVPETNSQWHDDKILQFNNCDVSFAVDIGDGLITPIIKEANLKTLSGISRNGKELIEKAKNKKLKPEDYMGGTFTISNLGMMGVDFFSAVINPPQSCILAIGKTVKTPVYSETEELKFRFADLMTVTLSADHRVVDGAVGARWLQVFKKYMENPILLTV